MGNGQWAMGNGEWGMGRGTEDGRRGIASSLCHAELPHAWQGRGGHATAPAPSPRRSGFRNPPARR
ncbi:MAG: hypothetical protein EA376_10495 [Phycisphaeraceae bacterium]|nr:MAG: hypothetical protein EA376_10495 [Phycisphaeraceae bacterium]